ncbi:hypothetical protein ACRARH_25850 [Phytobacter ursingii]
MARRNDIFVAFRDALQLNPKGYMCLRTGDFIRELRKHNHHFTEQDANRWIELNQPSFVDKTPDFSENRLWLLRNMGRVR